MWVELIPHKVYEERIWSTLSLWLTNGHVHVQAVCSPELQFHLLSCLCLCPNFLFCQDTNHWTRANLNDLILILLMSSAVPLILNKVTVLEEHSSTHEGSLPRPSKATSVNQQKFSSSMYQRKETSYPLRMRKHNPVLKWLVCLVWI